VNVQADPTGDYKNLTPIPTQPPPLGPGASYQQRKEHRKQDNTWRDWIRLQTEDVPRIKAAIHAAETTLQLTGPLQVLLRSKRHHHAQHDELYHWTFSFEAPICHGRCVGHAYDANAPRRARIWNAAHAQIYNVSLFSKGFSEPSANMRARPK